jgi:hypothetical protein
LNVILTPKGQEQTKETMNLKNVIIGLVLVSAWFCPVASVTAAPIQATAILDTPPGYNAGAGAGLLTDGIVGGNNWLSAPAQYLGWSDPGYAGVDGGVDSGVPQPQLTFSFGGTYFVDSITIHYIVDYPPGTLRANVRAPDSMTALFSLSGKDGPFSGGLTEASFDDSPDEDANPGGGRARTLILNAAGAPANAVRLDLRTDGEWLMLSEVTFQGRAATNVDVKATAILDTAPGFNAGAAAGLLTDGVIGGDDWLNVPTYQYFGWQDAGYVVVDSGVDSDLAQPQLTFDLGGTYLVDSVTIHYNVDYPPGTLRANLRAPDSLTVTFSDSGPGGPFGGNIIETGFDDGPEGNPNPGGGQARSLTMSLGRTAANAVRLDFRTDGEWLFLSEVTIHVLTEITNAPPLVTNELIHATAILDTVPGFNAAAGAGLLTNEVIGGNNWLSVPAQYLGWADAGYAPVDGGVDSGVPQPQLTFDLGGNYFVDSVTIHYIVDYPLGTLRANLHAPDSMTVMFSAAGPSGPFGGNLVETSFDDSPDGDAAAGGGQARSLTMNLGSMPASAVRLDIRTDAEWFFVSEVTFRGKPITNVVARIPATAILDTRPNFNTEAGAGLLTDEIIGGNNWLSVPAQYLGWVDSGYVPVDGGVDSSVPQPQLTFDFGGNYFVDSVTISYIVDYPADTLRANVRAPDSMTAMFSASGLGGSFGGDLVETGFDDSPESNPIAGGGQARSLTMNLGKTPANAMRLDFRTDGEWLFLSEVTFHGTAVPDPKPVASLIVSGGSASIRIKFDTVAGLWYRVERADALPAANWTEVDPGWRQGLGLPLEVIADASGAGHQQGYFRIEISPVKP